MVCNYTSIPVMKGLIAGISGWNAMVMDFKKRKIENSVTLSTILLAIIFSEIAEGNVTSSLIGAFAGFLFSFPLFIKGVIGGGDSKLMVAYSSLCGFPHCLVFFFNAFISAFFSIILIKVEEGGIKEFLISSFTFTGGEKIRFSPYIVAGVYSVISGGWG